MSTHPNPMATQWQPYSLLATSPVSNEHAQLENGFQIYPLPVDSRIKIKSSSQVNFLAYCGSINQSAFTKF
jgi:hypothetical protein